MFESTLRLITGYIQSTSPMQDCFSTLVNIVTSNGSVNFIVSASTYVVNNTQLIPGMYIGAFYDFSAPTTLQYPPTYRALVVTPLAAQENVTINFFNMNLIASDQSLSLNLDSATEIVTANGQRYTCNPGNHVLLVYYTITTRSLPAITVPYKIIVME